MTITCPECGFSANIDPGKIPAGGSAARCPNCSCRFRVEPPLQAEPPPAEKLLVICPACREEQPFAAECRRCGVIFARYRPPERRKQQAPPEPATTDYRPLLRRSVWPVAALFGLLLLWILVKDVIPTSVRTVHETVGVTSGLKHSVVVRSDGTVWTWGDNSYGQLGNGRRDGGYGQPHKVAGLEDVVAVAAGERHTLALKKDGTVWGWGDNEQCQLGDPSGSVGRAEPAMVAGLEGVVAIAAGDFFSVVLRQDGTLWHFGNSFAGGRIDGRAWKDNANPRLIEGITDVAAVSCGRRFVIALRKNGSVWCWGENSAGQCGDGGNGIQWEPKEVAGLENVAAVAAGEHFALALKKEGTVWGWGWLAIAAGKNLERQSRPAPLADLAGISEIRAGYWMALALRGNGTVWHSGVGGKGSPGEQRSFGDILKRQPTAGVGAIFAGGKDAFLEKRDGTLLCWGLNDFGKVEKKGEKKIPSLQALVFDPLPADGETVSAAAEKTEAPAMRFQAVAAGSAHSLALAADGTVWAWGENEAGQVIDKPVGSANTPRQVCVKGGRPLEDMVSIAAGGNTSLAVKRDGTLWLWGQNLSLRQHVNMSRSGSNGEWQGGPVNYTPPLMITGVRDAVAVAGGYGGNQRFVVLHATGLLSRFGTWEKDIHPLQVRPLDGVTDVALLAAGTKHFAVLRKDGSVWTWGGNDSGQLGDGSSASRETPRRVTGIDDVVTLAAGNDATLAVRKDGTVWGWGKNIHAVTPQGLDVASAHSPLQIPGLKDIVSVAMPGSGFTNGNHYLAVDRSGRVYSWGFNSHGQLGNGKKSHDIARKPAMIDGLEGVTAVAAGQSHSLALLGDGTIRSWGGNSSGQLGNSSGTDSAFPVSVAGSRQPAEKKP